MNYQGDSDFSGALQGRSEKAEGAPPLCVDLDGTLVKTDLLIESMLALVKANPLNFFKIPLWLLRGKAHMKRMISERVSISAEALPYNAALLNYLQAEYASGRRLVLATASDKRIADAIAAHLGIFHEVIASDGATNMSGPRKAAALCARFGERGFAYAGDAHIDLSVWARSCGCVMVNSNERLRSRAARRAPIELVVSGDGNGVDRLRTFLRAMRVHQWVKNLLIFVPLLTAHRFGDIAALQAATLAFVAFSLCSSAVYLLNDLLDLEADRLHPTKRQRPFAAGKLPLLSGLGAIPLLLIAAFTVAALLSASVLTILLVYFALTVTYSFYLKQVVLLDVLVLAVLYTLRVIAGGIAVSLPLSPWLLAFSLFLFLSLALVKRFSELRALRIANKQSAKGRGYLAGDLEQLASLGAASGYIAVLVLALYINSSEVTVLYRQPVALWLICPVILYWVSRVWLLAHRGEMHQDPIVFALKDRVSYIVAGIVGVAMLIAA